MIAKTKTRKRPPTNTELLIAIEKMRSEDREEVNKRMGNMQDQILGLPTRADVTAVQTTVETMSKAIFDEHSELKLATKADVQPVIDLYRKLTLSAQITSSVGKWSSRSILAIAGALIAISVIVAAAKSGLLHLLSAVGK